MALPDGVPWQAAMMSALRGQATTWGGAANLPVPWTEDLLERPELWAIAEVLDPDAVLLATLAPSDLHGIVAGVEGPMPDGPGRVPDVPVTRPDPRAVLGMLGRRLRVLQRDGSPRVRNAPPAGSAAFPFINVAEIEQQPSRWRWRRTAGGEKAPPN